MYLLGFLELAGLDNGGGGQEEAKADERHPRSVGERRHDRLSD